MFVSIYGHIKLVKCTLPAYETNSIPLQNFGKSLRTITYSWIWEFPEFYSTLQNFLNYKSFHDKNTALFTGWRSDVNIYLGNHGDDSYHITWQLCTSYYNIYWTNMKEIRWGHLTYKTISINKNICEIDLFNFLDEWDTMIRRITFYYE